MTTARPNEIHIVRVYDAPLAAVWDAWTDPAKAARWWGPRGFTLTTHDKDLRPGGFWHYTMHGPDGTDYPNWTIYHEVEDGRKLVYDHGGYEDRPPLFRVTVLFSESDGRTTMDMTMALPTAEQAATTRQFIRQAGGNGTWDRLGEFLDQTTRGRDSFIINRSFDAPRDLVFRMWTDPEHFSKWLPPTGLAMDVSAADVRPGGSLSYRMSDGGDLTMYGRLDYEEIDEPRVIRYAQRFLDADGGPGHHPKLPVWPPALLTTVLFAEEGPDATRVTVRWQPSPDATPEQVAAFLNHRPSMTLGWTGSFDKLESHLADNVGVATSR